MMKVIGVCVVSIAFSAVASAQVPAGPEFRVNSSTAGRQLSTIGSVAMAPNGGFVVVWNSTVSYPGPSDTFGQRFDASGARVGAEFQVNSTPFRGVWSAYVAVDPIGNFVVVWGGGAFPDMDIHAQMFAADGARRGSEFLVNTTTLSNQYRPKVAADAAGNFVVVWHGENGDGSWRAVFAQRYDANGAPLGNEFRINSYTPETQEFPSIDSTPNGDFVVVWQSALQDGSGHGIFGQRFDPTGLPRGAEFRVNTYTSNSQRRPVVAVDANARFVVAWMSYGQDGDGRGVFAQRYDAAGTPLGPEFRVNTYTTGEQGWPSLDVTADGDFIVAWSSPDPDTGSTEVFGRRYDSAGAPRGGEFRINSYTPDQQIYPGVAAGSDGRFVVVWNSFMQDGSGHGVFGQRFGGLEPAALVVDDMAGSTSDGNGVLEAGETVVVAPAWFNANAAAHTFSGAASAFMGPGAPGDPAYAIADATATYGTVLGGAAARCTATADCYVMGATIPGSRPGVHWDASFREDILPATELASKTWVLHFGDSFIDVPRSNGFYRFIETLLHHGVTGGCSPTQYCPATATTRDQMAVFVLVAKEGTGYTPPACTTPVFDDVPASNPFCRWIEELARRAVVGGCGGGNYCPFSAVTREQMAVFVLRTLDPALAPPACTTPIYNDVPASSGFCRWIEELTRRGVVTGCGGGNYCPAAAVTREQMGVFISVTFGLTLYGP